MRARPTLIPLIAAVVLSLAPALPAQAKSSPSAASGRSGWFANVTVGLDQRVESVARLQVARSERLAAVAQALTTAPPPLPPPPPPVSEPSSFIWPAKGPITSQFGSRWGRAHTGVDIDGATGSAVVAAQSGTVKHAGWKNGYGQTVIIDHGRGISTLYAHLSSVSVRVGQAVPQGQYLGPVGATGNVTAAHLHYEVHVGGAPRNPASWL